MSSSDVAISIRGLSKSYHVMQVERRSTLAETALARLRRPLTRPKRQTFWALKDVDLVVKRGDVVGVIGRNGAGKSTLLKILSRITRPTTGSIDLYGRVGSLLEVGTGFHPELTGRENIFLNGAILGMRRSEIRRQFDSIVNFAEIEPFLDTPVKRYSSGMYVRLAFAVAAHLNLEILVVDEVLAVGDVEFQRKCLAKMNDVANSGRTVLFVSHNMAAIQRLCTVACLLRQGCVGACGNVEDVVRLYLSDVSAGLSDQEKFVYRRRGESISVDAVDLLVDGAVGNSVQAGQACTIRVHYNIVNPKACHRKLSVSILLFAEGHKLVNLWTNYQQGQGLPIYPRGHIDCHLPHWPFRGRQFRADVYTHIGPDEQDWIEECLLFNSYDGDYYGSGVITNPDQGMLFLDHSWSSHASQ